LLGLASQTACLPHLVRAHARPYKSRTTCLALNFSYFCFRSPKFFNICLTKKTPKKHLRQFDKLIHGLKKPKRSLRTWIQPEKNLIGLIYKLLGNFKVKKKTFNVDSPYQMKQFATNIDFFIVEIDANINFLSLILDFDNFLSSFSN
jgi:hypothetical protein